MAAGGVCVAAGGVCMVAGGLGGVVTGGHVWLGGCQWLGGSVGQWVGLGQMTNN